MGAPQFYTMQNVFYLPETSGWSYIQQQAKQGYLCVMSTFNFKRPFAYA